MINDFSGPFSGNIKFTKFSTLLLDQTFVYRFQSKENPDDDPLYEPVSLFVLPVGAQWSASGKKGSR